MENYNGDYDEQIERMHHPENFQRYEEIEENEDDVKVYIPKTKND